MNLVQNLSWTHPKITLNNSDNTITEEADSPQLLRIKNAMSRIIINHHSLEFLEHPDYRDTFCDKYYEDDISFLDLAVQAQYLAAVQLLHDLESVFILELPKAILHRCEALFISGRSVYLPSLKNFILELTDDDTLNSMAFIKYFLINHQSCQINTAEAFYSDLFRTLVEKHEIRKAEIQTNCGKANTLSRKWYADVLGIPFEANQSEFCVIQ